MPQVVAAPTTSGNIPGGEGGAKDTVSVILKDGGQSKLQVIKIVKDLLGLGLKEAKDLVDGAPKPVKENMGLAEAEDLKKKLEAAGATVELVPA
ncbi:MAG: 50S ribosomal protein L7/L12, partial [Leptonema sp. (in: bacteria)]